MLNKENKKGLYLLVPSIVLILLIIIIPLAYVFNMSFYFAHLLRLSNRSFAGISNYLDLLTSQRWQNSLITTTRWVVISVFLINFFGLCTALILNCKFIGRSLVRGIVLIPWIVSTIVVAFLVKWLFHDLYGVVNYLLVILGIIDNPIAWFTHNRAFMMTALTWIYKLFPFSAIILLAGLQTIPDQLYEAAEIDGASSWQRFLHITLPGLKGVFIVTILLTTLWSFNAFEVIWLLTEGGPANVTDNLSIFGYRTSFRTFDIGKGSANSVLMFIVTFIFSMIYMFLIFKDGEES